MRQPHAAAVPVFAASILFALSGFGAVSPAEAATVTASANSYETSQSDTQPASALAFVERHGPGAPGWSRASADARLGALGGRSTMVGCGFEFNNFQQVCNDARTTSTFTDLVTIVAGVPNGTPVQVQATFDAGGRVDGIGGYSYQAYAHVNGLLVGNVSASTGGTVQVVNDLPITGSGTLTLNLVVGTTYNVTGYLSTNVFNRWCAGGSADCVPSATVWTLTVNLGSGLRLAVSSPLPGAQIVSEGGHDYTAPTAGVGEGAITRSGLSPAWPNPTRGSSSLSLALARETPVDVAVFDLAGRRVATLSRATLGPGSHALAWDGRDEHGAEARGGVYFVRARGPGLDATRRVLRLR